MVRIPPSQPQAPEKAAPAVNSSKTAPSPQPSPSAQPIPAETPAEPIAEAIDLPTTPDKTGQAKAHWAFFEEIVNPWAAPDLEAVRQGEVIKFGDEGDSVTQLQERLTALGYGVEATGTLGATTQEVLKKFQTDHGVEATGKFGPASLQALEAAETKKAEHETSIETLKNMKSKELYALSRKDPAEFFKALLPAALESERLYGVPAAMTLAQGSAESEFARAPIGGFNIFGIKGSGPAGTVNVSTREVVNGKDITIKANFARYHNYFEAVSEHGKLYNNGYYDAAIAQYAQDKDTLKFVDNVSKTYATDPDYAKTMKWVMRKYNLLELVEQAR